MRADSVSEYKFLYPSMTSNAISHIERVQKKCVLESDICLMVSNALKKNIFHRYGDIDKTYIIPSIGRSDIFSYDSNIRECVRDKLGLSDKFVIGYSGSMHSWQRVDKAFELFEIVQSFRNDAVLLILTKDIEKAHELYGKNANSIIMSIEYEDLGRYVQCFDLGVLLRDKILLNKVSSPTKFSEYILCGVPVFVSTGIGDLEDIVTNMKLGVCVENFDDRSEFEREIKKFLITLFNRNLIAEFGKYYFCREAYINIYNDIYS
ncbi:MAG: hypothetical protein SVZ03_02460 [Spirochaetota bacterium]|nr:hypothetical protein [Spirochaetota bacterium]